MRKPADIYDEWLVLKCQSGDNKAFSLLIEKWNSKVLSQAYYQMKDYDGAKDVVQEVWTSVIKSIHKLNEPKKFRSWLYRIVYLKSVDWVREKKKDRDGLSNSWEIENSLLGEQEGEEEEKIQLIQRSLKEMKESERMIIRLFYLEGQNMRAISEIMGIPTGTVKSKLFYAREHLKKLIKSKSYEQE
ncbi:MAG: sigma-70 family RNA polymerase sigma factor [bacterium]|jgi:RNA polymerase sigma factor (sigma-70 family)|nr:sigma-70 family RNA polymerase sigma factor [bacterium]